MAIAAHLEYAPGSKDSASYSNDCTRDFDMDHECEFAAKPIDAARPQEAAG